MGFHKVNKLGLYVHPCHHMLLRFEQDKNLGLLYFTRFKLCCRWGHPCFTNTCLVKKSHSIQILTLWDNIFFKFYWILSRKILSMNFSISQKCKLHVAINKHIQVMELKIFNSISVKHWWEDDRYLIFTACDTWQNVCGKCNNISRLVGKWEGEHLQVLMCTSLIVILIQKWHPATSTQFRGI